MRHRRGRALRRRYGRAVAHYSAGDVNALLENLHDMAASEWDLHILAAARQHGFGGSDARRAVDYLRRRV